MKTCTKCGIGKPLDEFSKRSGSRSHLYSSWCKDCKNAFSRQWHRSRPPGSSAAQSKKWRSENPERSKELNRRAARRTHTKLRMEMISAYGGKCSCCGESDPHFLTIEHKSGRGNRPEDHKGVSGTKMLYLIRAEGYPDDYTVMCWNCNCSRGIYGFCPHQPHEAEDRRYV